MSLASRRSGSTTAVARPRGAARTHVVRRRHFACDTRSHVTAVTAPSSRGPRCSRPNESAALDVRLPLHTRAASALAVRKKTSIASPAARPAALRAFCTRDAHSRASPASSSSASTASSSTTSTSPSPAASHSPAPSGRLNSRTSEMSRAPSSCGGGARARVSAAAHAEREAERPAALAPRRRR